MLISDIGICYEFILKSTLLNKSCLCAAIVRVKTIHALLPPQNVLLNLNIRDSTFKYSVKITRISCDMITGVSGK